MSVLTIVKPEVPILINGIDVVGSTNTGNSSAANAATVDPKEVAVIPASSGYSVIDYDFGVAVKCDSLFIGYHNAVAAAQTVQFQQLSSFGGGSVLNQTAAIPLLFPGSISAPYQASAKLAASWNARYIRAVVTNPTQQLTIGLFNAGQSVQPIYGHEFGSGRPVIDTGTAERLPSGGFGISPGKIVGGWQWQFADIQPSELPALYALLRRAGNTNPVWVVEDPDQTAGINERTHYGLLNKIDVYERIDPDHTRYALQMEEWG